MQPKLIGVIHLPPLPGSPRNTLGISKIAQIAVDEAVLLESAGFDSAIVENFGDIPFHPTHVPPITIACITTCVRAVCQAARLEVGVNVLRNDAQSALAVAIAGGAHFVRINVHSNAAITDQGILQGMAHQTLRDRKFFGGENINLLCDVDVKHGTSIDGRSIVEHAEELTERAMCDALLVTGCGTGKPVATDDLRRVHEHARVPVYAASGVTVPRLRETLALCDGVIVGSALRREGRAGNPIDADRTHEFANAFARARTTTCGPASEQQP